MTGNSNLTRLKSTFLDCPGAFVSYLYGPRDISGHAVWVLRY